MGQDALTARVLAQVEADREGLIADVVRCVRIPSVVGHEGAAQRFMQELYARLGLDVDAFEADLREVARHPAFVRTAWGSAGRPTWSAPSPAPTQRRARWR